ncbi:MULTISPECIES: alkane 1-monooxygenase [unclassified Streptomyces]|uniref:alkane 1-monooxygenase n=1 Tax=unclassified Streptomyces TaxID=2593676 RepID=UPI00225BFF09|nr:MULTISPECIES: alkane 1-monooxygenase [unclassified Streptomyces]MCX5137443.1 alkane 1-monooxygenase [Streptomyces sp. NBC_00340]WSD81191.1 alkane 1-monooxygenase [Streptomyces sp. NBC_01558]WSK64790.1 alkane 1-monooxygenase [Streptomyces sp. NBC_01281]
MSEAAHPPPRAHWRDPKRPYWLLGLAVPTLPFQAGGLAAVTGLDVFWWWGPFFAFVLLPLADHLIGDDGSNPPETAYARLDADRYYRWCTYLYLPLQYGALVWSCTRWADGGLGPVAALGLTASTGVVAGVAINTAHELGHKREHLERLLSRIALAQSFYGHFYVEHNHGHHIRVATAEDPASSRMGESFWGFLPRAVAGSLASAWRLEVRRLRRRGHRVVGRHNDVLTSWLTSLTLFTALAAAFGPHVLPFLAGQAVLGFSLLESVNYLEHYGLLRERRPDGRYVRVAPRHSWNSDHTVSNLFLFQLQRHSDHHANPLRRYQTLRHFDEAPRLPSGYATMIVLAWIPPLWRRVMDPKLLVHYGGDVTRANLAPAARARLLRRYPAGASTASTA